MTKALKLIAFLILGLAAPTFMSCEQPPTVTANPDITGNIAGSYNGNYIVNYENDPANNFSSQIILTVSRVDKKQIRIDAQGGDSFECTLSGTSSNSALTNIINTSGVYQLATDLEGYYINGTLYYKVTGVSNGGNFSAEFTVI
ncbi:MAG: hypothetical protein ACI9GM_000372 [Salibacteraceae bacterium]|jgi:hypothetical protein